jgi:hypothetical protein
MEQDFEASSVNKRYLQINGKEAEEQLLAGRGGEEERLRHLLAFFDSLPLACRGGEGGRRVVVPAPALILYPIDNHLELKCGWDCGLPSARCRQGDGVPRRKAGRGLLWLPLMLQIPEHITRLPSLPLRSSLTEGMVS